MVNATNPDGNSSDTTSQGGEMERKYKNDGSTAGTNSLEDHQKMDYMRFKTTQKDRSTTRT